MDTPKHDEDCINLNYSEWLLIRQALSEKHERSIEPDERQALIDLSFRLKDMRR